MSVGKAFVTMVVVMIAATAMVTIFSIAMKDKSTDTTYADVNNTINSTMEMTQKVTGTGTGFMSAMILIVAILAFGSVIMIFRKK